MTLLEDVDPRLQASLHEEWGRRRGEPVEGIPSGVTVVLAGHRAAGKSSMLPRVAKALERTAVDLDTELQTRHQRSLKDWVEQDEAGFRVAERELFGLLPRGQVVAVGGGFLSHHAAALRGCLVVEVPISFETYAERLRDDVTRARLRPELTIDQELREIYAERAQLHAAARPLSFVDFMLRLVRGRRARRVVTLPPHEPIEVFAWRAKHAGAELLEIRSDLHPAEIDLLAASRALPLLVARRTPSLPAAWRALASVVDEPQDGSPEPSMLRSLHVDRPLNTVDAVALWRGAPPGSRIKHVEPLGSPGDFLRLLETQRVLIELFGVEQVTVLATGPWALPFRAVLAQRNALDYVALDGRWAAAPGQRLLADAVREAKRAQSDGTTRRLGILGGSLAHSRSPRIHEQPFDRIGLPEDAPLGELLEALQPHYRGFAITNPFKKRVAAAVPTSLRAVNTLVRAGSGWHTENSDVAGAEVVFEALGPLSQLTVLGDGGVTEALRLGAGPRAITVLTRATIPTKALTGPVVWTWPPGVTPPEHLRFDGARVAIVSYGAGAREISAEILKRGGQPVRLGARWFIAQARRQRLLWESAT